MVAVHAPRAATPPRRRAARRTRAASSSRSFDHLVGTRDERRRQLEPKRLGGLEVDSQLEFDRLLHREVGGLGALQNLMHVAGRAPEQVGLARLFCSEHFPPWLLAD